MNADATRPVRAPRVTAVMITRDRAGEAVDAIGRLRRLPEEIPIVVVDNGSSDDTPAILRRVDPLVTVVELGRNAGCAGRNVGASLSTTPYVAFVDDDSTWAAGSLDHAADLLDAHPRLALVAARIVVGDAAVEDPVCREMAGSSLPRDPTLPGPPVLGFVACAAVVRRDAFLGVGGFDERYGVGGEEEPVAVALAAQGWQLTYVAECVAQHWPSPVRDPGRRRRIVARNDLWSAWRHRAVASAVRITLRSLGAARHDGAVRAGVVDAARGAWPVLRGRRRAPRWLERQLRLLD